jgi:isopenicillin N synthase-like dioxygenase
MNEFLGGKAQQPLPPSLAVNEDKINDFVKNCQSICHRILEMFAIGLEIEQSQGGSNWFAPRHDSKLGQSGSVFRLLYYPKLPDDLVHSENDLRCGSHSDYGTLTLLFQHEGQPGLEILTDAETDSWAPIPVNPTGEPSTPILVNVGDLLSFWTNGVLKSAVHRVTLPDPRLGEVAQDRYSIAYFCHPLDTAKLEPVPSKTVQQHRPETNISTQASHDNVMTAREHLESRLQATYQ